MGHNKKIPNRQGVFRLTRTLVNSRSRTGVLNQGNLSVIRMMPLRKAVTLRMSAVNYRVMSICYTKAFVANLKQATTFNEFINAVIIHMLKIRRTELNLQFARTISNVFQFN
jgi:hypothetical protein